MSTLAVITFCFEAVAGKPLDKVSTEVVAELNLMAATGRSWASFPASETPVAFGSSTAAPASSDASVEGATVSGTCVAAEMEKFGR